ncbi:ABC transporter permease [Paenibacillus xanthanilyticus]|uniref:ABC transporter permease n=1 Tax=Paenibacillus xanthanilyticus TaxID=1783531 RepID=A0ABV8K195_9BACL
MNTWRIYRLLVASSLRSRMQYKFNFWFSSIMSAFISAVEFAMLAVILHKFGHIQGWSLAESGYLYAVLHLARTLYRTFASDVHHLEKYLVSGDLDGLLLRPVPVLLGLMTLNVSIRFGELVQGFVILVWSMHRLIASGQIGFASLPLTLIAIFSGAVLMFGIGLATASVGFWITRIEVLQNITEDASRTAAQYPLTIYPKWMQGLLLSLIPIAFANYMPALYILRGQGGWWLLAAAVGVALSVLGAGWALWRIGLTRYQSTGS